MKKLLTIVLAMLMLVSLTACGSSSSEKDADDEDAIEEVVDRDDDDDDDKDDDDDEDEADADDEEAETEVEVEVEDVASASADEEETINAYSSGADVIVGHGFVLDGATTAAGDYMGSAALAAAGSEMYVAFFEDGTCLVEVSGIGDTAIYVLDGNDVTVYSEDSDDTLAFVIGDDGTLAMTDAASGITFHFIDETAESSSVDYTSWLQVNQLVPVGDEMLSDTTWIANYAAEITSGVIVSGETLSTVLGGDFIISFYGGQIMELTLMGFTVSDTYTVNDHCGYATIDGTSLMFYFNTNLDLVVEMVDDDLVLLCQFA